MLWTWLLGTRLLWTWIGLLWTTNTNSFSYNWYSLQNDNIRILELKNFEWFSLSPSLSKTAREPWSSFIRWEIDSNTKIFPTVFKASTIGELQSLLSSARQKLSQPNKELKITRLDWTSMTTTATCTSFKPQKESYHVTFTPVEIEFIINDPFFYWSTLYEESFTWKSSSFTDLVEYTVWEQKARPQISINFLTWLSSVTTITVTLNDSIISVTWTFSDSDIILIDCKEKDVYKNSVWGQSYTWSFGDLDIWTNDFEVAIDGTWSADIYVQRYATYV